MILRVPAIRKNTSRQAIGGTRERDDPSQDAGIGQRSKAGQPVERRRAGEVLQGKVLEPAD